VTTISHYIALAVTLLLAAGHGVTVVAHAAGGGPAHGAPGEPGTWTNAAKVGIGTSYEAYVDGTFADTGTTGVVSKVWFSIAQGIVTEAAHGLIHENQVRDLQLLITGPGFFHEERRDVGRRHEPDLMAQAGDRPRPVVSARARLHPHQTGGQPGEEPDDLRTSQPATEHDPPLGVDCVQLKHILRQIQADCGNLHRGRLPQSRGPSAAVAV
jgi:hypothetical protein